jgi:CubicO group peptidase (beta-lactamase class C family)
LGGSSYCDERPIIPWRAEGYEAEDGELVNDSYLSMNQPGAAGALCSTVPDLLTWTDALTAGQVVSPESYAQMTTPFTLNDGSETGYGFGLGVGELEGHPRISHGGGINGFVTMMAHYPETDMTVVVLSNTVGGHSGEVAEAVSKWALGIEEPPVLDLELSTEEMAVYVGVYEIRAGFELNVFVEDGRLMTQATNQNAFRIRAQGNHLFIPTFDDAVRLIFAVEDGKATTAILHQGGQVIEAARIR